MRANEENCKKLDNLFVYVEPVALGGRSIMCA